MADIEDASDLTAFQRTILVILAEESRYGLAIKRELEDYYDETINHGRLYPNLDQLVEAGLVEKGEIDARTNSYQLTYQGATALREEFAWVADRVAGVTADRSSPTTHYIGDVYGSEEGAE